MRSHETISLGWCDPGTTDGEFTVAGMMLAAARTARLGPVIRVEGSCLISKLRNQIVAAFLQLHLLQRSDVRCQTGTIGLHA